ncbi:hypothetical protein [Lactobacillus paraplantarum] [Lactiplantibacillus mudanjiangensis]|nr:hypothetical protein [Lactobacillus paraplantarum] [Lactiplantibacillus mudanjiangensis]
MAKMIQSKYGYEQPEWIQADARLDKWLKNKRLAEKKQHGVFNLNTNKLTTNLKKYEVSAMLSFGEALIQLKNGQKLKRSGWNGKGIFIKLFKADGETDMSHDYIYIDTTGLKTNNPDAPLDRVPWLGSQTDILADDWIVVE